MYRLLVFTICLLSLPGFVFGQDYDVTDFSVTQGGNYSSILSWSSNNAELKGFIIEKSINGEDYFELAFVENKTHGNSSEAYGYIDYDFSDHSTYRLKEVSSSELSPFQEIKIAHSSTHNIELYPNPVTNDHVSFNGPDQLDFKLFLTDANGSMIAKSYGSLRDLEGMLNGQLPNLNEAIYFVRLEGQHGNNTIRLVKQ